MDDFLVFTQFLVCTVFLLYYTLLSICMEMAQAIKEIDTGAMSYDDEICQINEMLNTIEK